MPDQVIVTTNKGWFSRIGSAFAGVLVGIILIFGCGIAFAVYRFGRGRAKKTLAAETAAA